MSDSQQDAGSEHEDAQKSTSQASSAKKKVETTTQENPAADLRNMRRIIAEDEEWSLCTVPLLSELCISHIVKNFEYNSLILNRLLLKHKSKVLKRISDHLPLSVTANLVQDEDYWKRCCAKRWDICDVVQYGDNWKRMYFERNLQDLIEHYVPGTDQAALKNAVELSKNYVQRLDIRQLLPPVRDNPRGFALDEEDDDAASDGGDEQETDHFDFGDILPALPGLQELRVAYTVKDCGMNFEWNLFQYTARDCLQLSKCVSAAKHLRSLTLHRSKVDDDKIRVMISHILDHPALEELDVSHNVIGDRGARAVGKLLNNHSRLVRLNVADNQIRLVGAQAIAHALTKNTTLRHLNLRLNRIGDDGGKVISKALLRNSTLEEINLGSNELGETTTDTLSEVITKCSTLRKIDLTCNRLGLDGGKQLQEGIEENRTITHLDLHLTECGQEAEYCINQILHKNRELAREKMLAKDKGPTRRPLRA